MSGIRHLEALERPTSDLSFAPVDLDIPEKLERPLWVDMITGRVFEIPGSSIVWKKDGSKVAFALTNKPKVTFSENSLMINSNTVTVSYDLEDMAKFTYEDSESQGIRNIENDKVSSFKFDGEMLLFPSLLLQQIPPHRYLRNA